MTRVRTLLLAALLPLTLLAARTQAGDPIRFARTPDISPDGKLVAFSYLGDIWVVPATGGLARPVTMHEKHEFYPAFSPDGKKIAFSSNRHGKYDVFVVPVEGGRPTRLTFDSADEYVCGWTPDGKNVLFYSTRGTAFPPRPELYTVPVAGGEPRRVSAYEGRDGTFSPKGDLLAYVRGPGLWYRKGYRGSSNDDIWIADADGHHNRQFTRFNGQDTSPSWSPDGRYLYYVTEFFGTPANIVRQEVLTGPPGAPGGELAMRSEPQQITFHKEDGVRRARLSGNGEWLVYECGADLYVVSARGGAPRKLQIEVYADDKTNPDLTRTFTSGASEFAVAPDEKHIAFVIRGEIFLMPRGGGKATRLTNSPSYDHGLAWSPDSTKLLFLSDRGGQEDVYLLEPDDPEHPQLGKARKFKVRQLTSTPEAEVGLTFSPDGKRVSFLRAGRLVTMKPDGSDVKVVVNEPMVIDYEWSPDSKWFCYARLDGSFASELYIVPAGGPTPADPARNITHYATFNAGVTWSKQGGKIAFLSERHAIPVPGLYVLSLQKPPAADAKPGLSGLWGEAVGMDWEDIHLRVTQPTTMPVLGAAISPDGKRVAFRAASNGEDLWIASTDGKDVTRVTTGNLRPTQIHWSRLVPSIVYFRDGSGMLHMASGASAPVVPFKARVTVKRDALFAEMFEQSWRAINENFYDPNFHGANWKAVREKFRPLVKHVVMREDLYALISLMLGELNASHLGIMGPASPSEEVTADLGILFDENYHGPGLKVADVLKRGPADRRGLNLKAGDIIWRIDYEDVSGKSSLAQLLNDKVGQPVLLEVSSGSPDPKDRRRVEVQAVSRDVVRKLTYEHWVERNARRVGELSKGKLGYIHIPTMDDAGLDKFVRALYSDNFDKEGIVLDVRFNGGGFTHDRILNYLGGKEHTMFLQRHGGTGAVLRAADRKWTKPLILLINNRSYSDAEIFPSAFRTLGLGKLVGQPTGGFVIGTAATQLVDGSLFRVPRTGVFTLKGVNMEREGVIPDVVVEPNPDDLARGIDAQLDRAAEVLLQDVAAWKKTHPGVALRPPREGPPLPVVRPAPNPPAAPIPVPGSTSPR
jgi:tricorn protease